MCREPFHHNLIPRLALNPIKLRDRNADAAQYQRFHVGKLTDPGTSAVRQSCWRLNAQVTKDGANLSSVEPWIDLLHPGSVHLKSGRNSGDVIVKRNEIFLQEDVHPFKALAATRSFTENSHLRYDSLNLA